MNLIEHIDSLLEAKTLTTSTIEKLKHSDEVIVYHGTTAPIVIFLSGLDTNRPLRRLYPSGPKMIKARHAGLFVTKDLATAKRFGDKIVEFKTKARNLHGPSWGGEIRNDLEKSGGYESTLTLADEMFPDSFRPLLSYMLMSGEPQALHLGLIRPKDILRVYVDGEWRKPSDAGLDLSSPDLSIDDYLGIRGLSADKLSSAISRGYKDVSELERFLRGGDSGTLTKPWGLPPLGPIAARSMSKRMWSLRQRS
jgi:hypothetical protein